MCERQWAGNRLKDAVIHAAEDPSYWGSAAGRELLWQLERFVSGSVARQVGSKLSYRIEAAEITHSIMLELHARGTLLAGLKKSDNPWAYLATCARGLGWAQATHRVLELDAFIETPASGHSLESLFDPDHGLTLIDEVIGATICTLGVYINAEYQAVVDLPELVRWFALNPPQHQGHGHSDARHAPELRAMGFTSVQIGALANVTWGGRPNMHHTSLFYGYLLDPLFVPEASRTHRLALTSLRRTFVREHTIVKGHAS